MEIFGLLSAIFGLVCVIVFFVMAAALGNISNAMKNMNRIISAWSDDTGIGLMFHCKKCKKNYMGRQSICPNCKDPKDYTSLKK